MKFQSGRQQYLRAVADVPWIRVRERKHFGATEFRLHQHSHIACGSEGHFPHRVARELPVLSTKEEVIKHQRLPGRLTSRSCTDCAQWKRRLMTRTQIKLLLRFSLARVLNREP